MEKMEIYISGFTPESRKKWLEEKSILMKNDGWNIDHSEEKGFVSSIVTISRPKNPDNPKKKRYGLTNKDLYKVIAATFGFILLLALIVGSQPPKLLNESASAYVSASSSEQKSVVSYYLEEKKLPKSLEGPFYDYMSQSTYAGIRDTSVQYYLEQGRKELEQYGGHFGHTYYNLDSVNAQFSPFDGSHRELEKEIKSGMHNPDSYEHIRTRYRVDFPADGSTPYVWLNSTFRGTNGFGAVVQGEATATASYKDGTIYELSYK
jgi:hypothetical protein